MISRQEIQAVLAFTGAVLGFLSAVLGFLAKNNLGKPSHRNWKKKIVPILSCILWVVMLPLGNGLIIGVSLYLVGLYYFEAESLDLLVTSKSLLVCLVTVQTLLVSAYSLGWTIAARRIFLWLSLREADQLLASEHQAGEPLSTNVDAESPK